ncbi:Mitochondrial carnitine acylcarnitine carrier [Micractinium conductrix]|uniref:Mitochondrial carnitine acylcarnitine carrier n=1 Tax=Micractinium conductrix TaxID=554055 RepID=A0A2P6VAW3_9CHLO|nr:Mitochondrial carnitine acylcarnitine carrier [Micractinium conductrix]|eukprot:PSC71230.1 Mitochondrial carnitine acylcarnitine carrier [Micractinium conductrix]
MPPTSTLDPSIAPVEHEGPGSGAAAGVAGAEAAMPQQAEGQHHTEHGVAVDLASGTAAGIAQLLVGHPFDTVKVVMQTSAGGVSAGSAVRRVVGTLGPLGFYRGMGAPLATVAAYNALVFSSWGAVERVLSPDGAPLTGGQAMLAGAIAGVPVSLLACPTELLKCRLQAQGGALPPPGAVYSLSDVKAGRALFRGPVGVMRSVMTHEGGLLGLYRGLVPTLLREVPGNAAYFGGYEAVKALLARHQGISESQLGAGSLVVAGGVGGAAYWLCIYPFDVIKSKLQTQNVFAADRYTGVVDCGVRLYREAGWRALWRGFTPCFLRSVPANSAAFLTFESVRSALSAEACF